MQQRNYESRVHKIEEIKKRLADVLQRSNTPSEKRCYFCVSAFCQA